MKVNKVNVNRVNLSRVCINTVGTCSKKKGEPIPEPDITDALLMEDGSLFLMEDGTYFKLESVTKADMPKIDRSYWNF